MLHGEHANPRSINRRVGGWGDAVHQHTSGGLTCTGASGIKPPAGTRIADWMRKVHDALSGCSSDSFSFKVAHVDGNLTVSQTP